MPANPLPVPSAPPGSVPIPAIPLPPGAQSILPAAPGQAYQVILPVGYVPSSIALTEDIRPYVNTLHNSLSPSARIMAVRALAEGRHGSTEQVKSYLYQATQSDPCPAVRASCIDHLCQLGYYHPSFVSYLKRSVDDPSEEVRESARLALVKMSPTH